MFETHTTRVWTEAAENKLLQEVARPERLELPTLWFEARCSIQLSYGRAANRLTYSPSSSKRSQREFARV
jgi:hypothetical protein